MIDSNDWMHSLAWALLHFLWQGAAITALAAACMALFRRPATRYLAGIGALVLMVASFGVTFAFLHGPAATGTGTSVEVAPTPFTTLPAPAAATNYSGHAIVGEFTAGGRDFAWIAQAWLAGVFLLALRVASGLLVLDQLRRRNLAALPDDIVVRCRLLQHRLGIRRLVRYCECSLVGVPAVIGFFRPVVLLPVRALTGLSIEQLEAVIAHELGHIRRFDVLVNFFQVIAETLFFFHPAVWWLNRRIRADREDCCDDVAVEATGGKIGYARALATMEGWRDVPTLAMAATGSPLATRVARLLGVSTKNRVSGAGIFTATLVLAGALVAGVVSIGLAGTASAQSGPETLREGERGAWLIADELILTAGSTVIAQSAPAAAPTPAARAAEKPRPAANARPAAEPRAAAPASPASEPRGPSYIDSMKSVGFDSLDVDQLIALKVHDVTPEYVRAMRSAGFNPDPDQVVGMAVHDVTPEYVAQMRGLGFKPDAEEIIAMKAQDVTPEYVKAMRDAGMDASAEEMVAMKVQDVTPEYRKSLEAAGFRLSVEELIEAKVMEVTPEFISQVRAHGFKDLTIEQIIQLKNAEVL